MSLSVKASFLKADEKSELRRFAIPEDKQSYDFLQRKVAEIFTDNIVMMWKDADGDLVTFSSEEEFQEAVKNIDGVLKLFVSEKLSKDEIANTKGTPKNRTRKVQLESCIPGDKNSFSRKAGREMNGKEPLWETGHFFRQRNHKGWKNRGVKDLENIDQWCLNRKMKWWKRQQNKNIIKPPEGESMTLRQVVWQARKNGACISDMEKALSGLRIENSSHNHNERISREKMLRRKYLCQEKSNTQGTHKDDSNIPRRGSRCNDVTDGHLKLHVKPWKHGRSQERRLRERSVSRGMMKPTIFLGRRDQSWREGNCRQGKSTRQPRYMKHGGKRQTWQLQKMLYKLEKDKKVLQSELDHGCMHTPDRSESGDCAFSEPICID